MLPTTTIGKLLLLALPFALAAVPYVARPYYVELATFALILGMHALSLQLLVGCTGLVSLGHSAYFGIAAYTVYLMTPEGQGLPFTTTLPAAALTAALAAAVVGWLALRTRGFFFLMVTLAFGEMAFFVFHDTKLGGGTDGVYLSRPLFNFFGFELQLTRRERPIAVFYLCLALLTLMYLLLAFVLRSLFGRVLEGIRINEGRMQSLGFNTFRYKLAAFILAGLLAGVAGHMWAMHRGAVNPELVGWRHSAEALLMVLLGGLGTLHGPILGALAWVGLGEASQLLTERKLLVEGLVILAVVMLFPKGLTGFTLFGSGTKEPEAAPPEPDAVAAEAPMLQKAKADD